MICKSKLSKRLLKSSAFFTDQLQLLVIPHIVIQLVQMIFNHISWTQTFCADQMRTQLPPFRQLYPKMIEHLQVAHDASTYPAQTISVRALVTVHVPVKCQWRLQHFSSSLLHSLAYFPGHISKVQVASHQNHII